MRLVAVVILCAVGVCLPGPVFAGTATLNVNYNSVVGSINTDYGMNECDRAEYFAGLIAGFPNTQIIQNHKELGTKRIRVFYRNDWSQANLDALIASVLSANAVPLVCFQYVPSGWTYSQWGDWCASIVSRYRGMYDIGNWMWEIINEPDLTGWTQESYVQLFTVVEPKIHAVYPQAMVGGPATSGLLTSWNSAMLASSSGNNIQFISWHRYGGWYPGPNWVSDSTIIAQIPNYEYDLESAYNNLPADKKNVKLVLGEFNVNAWAGDINGLWSTDPRIKTIFGAVYYASVLKRLLRTANGRYASAEFHWEGTGDDYPGGPPGFGMWYSQYPDNRTPAFYAKRAIATNFPKGASLVSVTRSGTADIEAYACKHGSPAVNSLVIVNKSNSVHTVQVALQNATFTGGNWGVIDAASPSGRVEPAPSFPASVLMSGYGVRVLGPLAPESIQLTSGPAVIPAADSVTINWITDVPSDSTLYFGPTSSYGQTFTDSSLSTSHSFTVTGLQSNKQYHYAFKNAAIGYIALESGDFTCWTDPLPGDITSIGAVKALANGSSATIRNKIVTGVFPSDYCLYVEEPDKSSGLRISASNFSYAPGDVLNISGTMGTRVLNGINSERLLSATVIDAVSTASPVIPSVMSNKALGGTDEAMWKGVNLAHGPNNIGKLVSVHGRVTYVAGAYLYVDDGSGVPNMYGADTQVTGVMVQLPSAPSVTTGQWVRVTGIAVGSVPYGWTVNRRLVRCRDMSDLVILY